MLSILKEKIHTDVMMEMIEAQHGGTHASGHMSVWK